MVFLDEVGGIIHATLKKTLFYKFKNNLFEEKIMNMCKIVLIAQD